MITYVNAPLLLGTVALASTSPWRLTVDNLLASVRKVMHQSSKGLGHNTRAHPQFASANDVHQQPTGTIQANGITGREAASAAKAPEDRLAVAVTATTAPDQDLAPAHLIRPQLSAA